MGLMSSPFILDIKENLIGEKPLVVWFKNIPLSLILFETLLV